MTSMIILDSEQAERVRGLSPLKAGHAIVPVPLKDGRFMLGEEVLDDPTHSDVRDFLDTLPREDLSALPTYGPDDLDAPEMPEVASLSVRGG